MGSQFGGARGQLSDQNGIITEDFGMMRVGAVGKIGSEV